MIADRQRFERACARFDAANALDPNRESADGRDWPKELLYAERMSAMLERFAPAAAEPLRLAARCQHIQRWKIPRGDYPEGRIGYLQWRKQLQKFHAALAGDILSEVGYDEASIARVGSLLKKEDLKADADVQTLEDVIDLVFLESYLAAFVTAHGDYEAAKFDDILRKTAKKMSVRGRAAALSLIDIPAPLRPAVEAAMSEGAAPPAGQAAE